MEVLKAAGLSKRYGGGRSIMTWALEDVDLTIEKGEFLGVMGSSGSGKTTLLNLCAAIDTPTSGTIHIDGIELSKLGDGDLAVFRRRKLGFVFQDYNLLHTLSIQENVALPLALDGVKPSAILDRLSEVASQLQIEAIMDKRVFEVSGGEQQRAAIARAVVHRPSIILADEPTGNLDSKSSARVMGALNDLNSRDGAAVMLVTHDPFAASFCHRILFLRDGHIRSQIHRTGSRQSFFNEILGALTAQGGGTYDLTSDHAF